MANTLRPAESTILKYLRLNDRVQRDPGEDGEPALLVCWPYARMNKYQALLYSNAQKHGFEIMPIGQLSSLDDISWPGPIVFHAHWFAQLYRNLTSEESAMAAIDDAFRRILQFRDRTGATLIWTAHNIFPHDRLFPKASLALRRRTVEEFDAVHLLSATHEWILEDAYGRPLRQNFVVPHPTYEGVYPNFMSRDEARETLGIWPSKKTFLFFGSIQRYKHLDTLFQAFDDICNAVDDPPHLIVAGMPSEADAVAEAVEAGRRNRNISVFPEAVPDADVQQYFKAADYLVLPYADSLNSGVVMLGITFGLPVIAPTSPAFDPFRRFGGFSYDAEKPDGLTRALFEALSEPFNTDVGPHPDSQRFSPPLVSDQFFSNIRALWE